MKTMVRLSTILILSFVSSNSFANSKFTEKAMELILKAYSKRSYLSREEAAARFLRETTSSKQRLPFERYATIGSRTIDFKTPYVYQRHISDSGDVTYISFDLRTDSLQPRFKLEEILNWTTDAGDAVRVKRIYKRSAPIGKPNDIEAFDTIAVKNIDGNYFRVVSMTDVMNGKNIYHASIQDWIPFNGRNIRVGITKKDRYQSFKGTFQVPDYIQGKVVDLRISNDGTRLQFTTTNGESYKFSIERGDNGEAVFKQVAKEKLPDGVKRLLAEVKTSGTPISASSPAAARGLNVEIGRFSVK